MSTKYELSLWDDIIKTAVYEGETVRYFDEQKSYVLSADNMHFIGSAFAINLETDINGTNTLSFSIPMKYWDFAAKELVDNVLFSQCSNEKKVKLKRNDKWYTFVIKSVKEDSSQYIASVSAVDFCMNELSKTGYTLTFDNELYGNDGELNELAAKVMDGSSWTYIPVNEDNPDSPKVDLTEYKEELLYDVQMLKTTAPASIECEKISTDARPQEGTLVLTTSNGVITNPGHVFMFYSDIITEDDETEVIYLDNAVILQLLSSDYDYATKVEMIETLGVYFYLPTQYVDTTKISPSDYTVGKVVKSQKRMYSEEINQMLYAYRGPVFEFSQDYWGYTEWFTELNTTTGEYEWKFTNHYYQVDLNEASLNYLLLKKDLKGEIITWTDESGEFKPSYRGYSKVRTLNESKSNRFNLMQGLSETFQVWVDYRINCDESGKIMRDVDNITRAQKYITFRQSNSQVNNVGFTYGVNLGSISRTIDSNEVATKIYVEYIDNSALENGICSIQTARENFSQENYTLNFDYYVQKGLIDSTELFNDLYNVDDGYLGYFVNLHNYNEKIDLYNSAIIQLTTQIIINKEILDRTQDSVKAVGGNYLDGDVDVNGPTISTDPAAQNGTWRTKLLKTYKSDASKVIAITSPIASTVKRMDPVYVSLEYIPFNAPDTNFLTWEKWKISEWNPGDITLHPEDVNLWTVGCILEPRFSDNYANPQESMVLTRIQKITVDEVEGFYFTLSTKEPPEKIVEDEEGTPHPLYMVIEVTSVRNTLFPSTSDMLANVLNEADKMAILDELYEEWNSYKAQYIEVKTTYSPLLDQRAALIQGEGTTNLTYWQNLKSKLIKLFEDKYSRFIIEGTWSDSNYTNADSYYLDALKVAQTSGKPKVSYTLNASDLSAILGYELFQFQPGDVTYIEDPEYFGYTSKGTPYREKVIISKIKYDLLNPQNNQITLQNYMTQFEDLFQRISASVQSYNFNQNMYSRAGNFSAQSLNARILQNTLLGTNFVLLQSPDKSITIDGKGISLIDAGNPLNLMRVMSGGIFVSSDGGKSWVTGLTAQGLSADLITAGTINTSKINLSGGEGAPAFSWDIRGINAFAYDRDDQNNIVIQQNKFIRFDQYGFYLAELGTDETSENFDIGLASTINPVKYIQDRTRLSITWDGFYMKTNEGSVIIDPEKDLQVLTDSRQQRMRIGWYPKVSSEEDDPEITDPAGGYGLAIKNEADAFIFHTGLQESTGSDPYNPAIYMPNLPTTTTATDKLLFVGSDGKIYASKFTYANIDSISTAW